VTIRARMGWIAGCCLVVAGVASGADSSRTLKGTYEWTGGENKGPLEAVFTPAGEGKWEVAFHFEFDGQPHVYAGTAEGSLSEGALKGTVKTENKKRTFTFKGAFQDGTFTGTHADSSPDGEQPTGTLTLKSGGGEPNAADRTRS
jgi:hypothetical protein